MKSSENRWMFNFPELIGIVNLSSEKSAVTAKRSVPCVCVSFCNNVTSHKSHSNLR